MNFNHYKKKIIIKILFFNFISFERDELIIQKKMF